MNIIIYGVHSGSIYSRAAFIRGRCLFKGSVYSRAAFIRVNTVLINQPLYCVCTYIYNYMYMLIIMELN